MKNQIMKMKLIVAAALILSYSCKTVIQENIWSRSNNQINFIWESVEINGELKEKAAMSIPFRIEDIPYNFCLLYTSPSPRDRTRSRMPSSA